MLRINLLRLLFLFLTPFFFLCICSCSDNNTVVKAAAVNTSSQANDDFITKNRTNLETGKPFFIVKQYVLLHITPEHYSPLSKKCPKLGVGDIVFPVSPYTEKNGFFQVTTAAKNYVGWIHINDGISLDVDEDENLYFFSNKKPEYYLAKYYETGGNPGDSYKVILMKNIIPMLLGNFKTKGWFYPEDLNLALSLSKYCISIAKDQDTFFYASTMYDDWRINEYVISMNLLSDAYQKIGDLDRAAEIQNMLIKKYFWKRSDNTQTGGLNSIVKLEKIYIDSMLLCKKNSREYEKFKELLVETILLMDDKINYFNVMDPEWHQTASEWLIVNLEEKVSPDEFLELCDVLRNRTSSDGYADLIMVHKAIKMYKLGQKEEAMKIFTSFRSKNKLMRYLNINDWLSEMQIVPDSIIYQYDRF